MNFLSETTEPRTLAEIISLRNELCGSKEHDKNRTVFNITSLVEKNRLEDQSPASESDDCGTSISQRPINPLFINDSNTRTTLLLPVEKLVDNNRFWQGQISVVEESKKNVDGPSINWWKQKVFQVGKNLEMQYVSSADTFSPSNRMKNKFPVEIRQWYPVFTEDKLELHGEMITGQETKRTCKRRISGFIFHDEKDLVCSLEGPICSRDLSEEIVQMFSSGIPEDWKFVDSHIKSPAILNSDSTEPLTQKIEATPKTFLRPPKFSTPQNNTQDFHISGISKINNLDEENCQIISKVSQPVSGRTLNPRVQKHRRKHYTSFELQKKIKKMQVLLKATMLREKKSNNATVESVGAFHDFRVWNTSATSSKLAPILEDTSDKAEQKSREISPQAGHSKTLPPTKLSSFHAASEASNSSLRIRNLQSFSPRKLMAEEETDTSSSSLNNTNLEGEKPADLHSRAANLQYFLKKCMGSNNGISKEKTEEETEIPSLNLTNTKVRAENFQSLPSEKITGFNKSASEEKSKKEAAALSLNNNSTSAGEKNLLDVQSKFLGLSRAISEEKDEEEGETSGWNMIDVNPGSRKSPNVSPMANLQSFPPRNYSSFDNGTSEQKTQRVKERAGTSISKGGSVKVPEEKLQDLLLRTGNCEIISFLPNSSPIFDSNSEKTVEEKVDSSSSDMSNIVITSSDKYDTSPKVENMLVTGLRNTGKIINTSDLDEASKKVLERREFFQKKYENLTVTSGKNCSTDVVLTKFELKQPEKRLENAEQRNSKSGTESVPNMVLELSSDIFEGETSVFSTKPSVLRHLKSSSTSTENKNSDQGKIRGKGGMVTKDMEDTEASVISNTSSNLSVNLTRSKKGRLLCPKLPFWLGTRLTVQKNTTIINAPGKTLGDTSERNLQLVASAQLTDSSKKFINTNSDETCRIQFSMKKKTGIVPTSDASSSEIAAENLISCSTNSLEKDKLDNCLPALTERGSDLEPSKNPTDNNYIKENKPKKYVKEKDSDLGSSEIPVDLKSHVKNTRQKKYDALQEKGLDLEVGENPTDFRGNFTNILELNNYIEENKQKKYDTVKEKDSKLNSSEKPLDLKSPVKNTRQKKYDAIKEKSLDLESGKNPTDFRGNFTNILELNNYIEENKQKKYDTVKEKDSELNPSEKPVDLKSHVMNTRQKKYDVLQEKGLDLEAGENPTDFRGNFTNILELNNYIEENKQKKYDTAKEKDSELNPSEKPVDLKSPVKNTRHKKYDAIKEKGLDLESGENPTDFRGNFTKQKKYDPVKEKDSEFNSSEKPVDLKSPVKNTRQKKYDAIQEKGLVLEPGENPTDFLGNFTNILELNNYIEENKQKQCDTVKEKASEPNSSEKTLDLKSPVKNTKQKKYDAIKEKGLDLESGENPTDFRGNFTNILELNNYIKENKQKKYDTVKEKDSEFNLSEKTMDLKSPVKNTKQKKYDAIKEKGLDLESGENPTDFRGNFTNILELNNYIEENKQKKYDTVKDKDSEFNFSEKPVDLKSHVMNTRQKKYDAIQEKGLVLESGENPTDFHGNFTNILELNNYITETKQKKYDTVKEKDSELNPSEKTSDLKSPVKNTGQKKYDAIKEKSLDLESGENPTDFRGSFTNILELNSYIEENKQKKYDTVKENDSKLNLSEKPVDLKSPVKNTRQKKYDAIKEKGLDLESGKNPTDFRENFTNILELNNYITETKQKKYDTVKENDSKLNLSEKPVDLKTPVKNTRHKRYDAIKEKSLDLESGKNPTDFRENFTNILELNNYITETKQKKYDTVKENDSKLNSSEKPVDLKTPVKNTRHKRYDAIKEKGLDSESGKNPTDFCGNFTNILELNNYIEENKQKKYDTVKEKDSKLNSSEKPVDLKTPVKNTRQKKYDTIKEKGLDSLNDSEQELREFSSNSEKNIASSSTSSLQLNPSSKRAIKINEEGSRQENPEMEQQNSLQLADLKKSKKGSVSRRRRNSATRSDNSKLTSKAALRKHTKSSVLNGINNKIETKTKRVSELSTCFTGLEGVESESFENSPSKSAGKTNEADNKQGNSPVKNLAGLTGSRVAEIDIVNKSADCYHFNVPESVKKSNKSNLSETGNGKKSLIPKLDANNGQRLSKGSNVDEKGRRRKIPVVDRSINFSHQMSELSSSSFATISDVSSVSSRGRIRIPPLDYWRGVRIKFQAEELSVQVISPDKKLQKVIPGRNISHSNSQFLNSASSKLNTLQGKIPQRTGKNKTPLRVAKTTEKKLSPKNTTEKHNTHEERSQSEKTFRDAEFLVPDSNSLCVLKKRPAKNSKNASKIARSFEEIPKSESEPKILRDTEERRRNRSTSSLANENESNKNYATHLLINSKVATEILANGRPQKVPGIDDEVHEDSADYLESWLITNRTQSTPVNINSLVEKSPKTSFTASKNAKFAREFTKVYENYSNFSGRITRSMLTGVETEQKIRENYADMQITSKIYSRKCNEEGNKNELSSREHLICKSREKQKENRTATDKSKTRINLALQFMNMDKNEKLDTEITSLDFRRSRRIKKKENDENDTRKNHKNHAEKLREFSPCAKSPLRKKKKVENTSSENRKTASAVGNSFQNRDKLENVENDISPLVNTTKRDQKNNREKFGEISPRTHKSPAKNKKNAELKRTRSQNRIETSTNVNRSQKGVGNESCDNELKYREFSPRTKGPNRKKKKAKLEKINSENQQIDSYQNDEAKGLVNGENDVSLQVHFTKRDQKNDGEKLREFSPCTNESPTKKKKKAELKRSASETSTSQKSAENKLKQEPKTAREFSPCTKSPTKKKKTAEFKNTSLQNWEATSTNDTSQKVKRKELVNVEIDVNRTKQDQKSNTETSEEFSSRIRSYIKKERRVESERANSKNNKETSTNVKVRHTGKKTKLKNGEVKKEEQKNDLEKFREISPHTKSPAKMKAEFTRSNSENREEASTKSNRRQKNNRKTKNSRIENDELFPSSKFDSRKINAQKGTSGPLESVLHSANNTKSDSPLVQSKKKKKKEEERECNILENAVVSTSKRKRKKKNKVEPSIKTPQSLRIPTIEHFENYANCRVNVTNLNKVECKTHNSSSLIITQKSEAEINSSTENKCDSPSLCPTDFTSSALVEAQNVTSEKTDRGLPKPYSGNVANESFQSFKRPGKRKKQKPKEFVSPRELSQCIKLKNKKKKSAGNSPEPTKKMLSISENSGGKVKKRKLYSEHQWLESEECLSQNNVKTQFSPKYTLQFKQDFDSPSCDDNFSEVSALS